MKIFTEYPAWFIAFCLLAGLLYALVLYYRESNLKEAARHSTLKWLLGAARAAVISMISFLLLGPFIQNREQETVKPMIVIVTDNSASIAESMSEADQSNFQVQLKNISQQLSGKYDVREYSFGENTTTDLSFSFDESSTNMSNGFEYIQNNYDNQNLGAVILATDGIFNEGSSPLYSSLPASIPVFSIALGDTTIQRDLIIQKVYANKLGYLGDQMNILVDINATNAIGSSSSLNISKIANGQSTRIKSNTIQVNSNRFSTSINFTVSLDQPGIQHYRVAIRPISNERNTSNNVKDIFIDVLDARQNILIWSHSSHPDISALKQAIESNKNYEANVLVGQQPNLNPRDFDLVILNQIPNKLSNYQQSIEQLNRANVPLLFVLGAQSSISQFNSLQDVISIQSSSNAQNQVQAAMVSQFNLFSQNDRWDSELINYPPLSVPFGDYRASGNTKTFIQQKIGKVETQYPLWSFRDNGLVKTGVIAGEGLFRWRLFNFKRTDDFELFDNLISKSIQYLAVKTDKRKFRSLVDQNIFKETEAITFQAELYNESFELVNQPEVQITIKDQDGKNFPYTFSKTLNAYRLNAGKLPAGDYRFTANTTYEQEQYTSSGQFSVEVVNLEKINTTANHNLLQLLAEKHDGGVYKISEIESLQADIESRSGIKPVIYSSFKARSLLNLTWLFFLLVAFLGMEWFIRKWNGAY